MDKDNKSKYNPSLKYNIVMNTILLVSQYIYPLITFPYVSRVLDASGIGKVNFALSFVAYFVILSTLGIPTYGIRCVANARDDKEKLNRVMHELISMIIVCMALSVIIYLVCIFYIPRFSDTSLYLVVGLNIILSSFNLQWFYQGIEQYGYITKRTIFVRTVSVIFILLMVKNPDDYIWYAIGSILTEAGNSIFNLFNLRKYISFKYDGTLNYKRHLKPILLFFTSSIALSVYNYIDVTMLGVLVNEQQVGFYTVGIKISKMLLALITTINTVLLPRLSNYTQNKEYDKCDELVKVALRYDIILSLPLIIFCSLFSSEIILFLSGTGYGVSSYVLISSIPILFIVGLSGIISYLILMPRKKEKYVTLAHIVGLLINIVFNYILIPIFGCIGASLATTLTELAILVIVYISASKFKLTNFKLLFKNVELGKYFIACAVFVLICFTLKKIEYDGIFVELLSSSCISFASYFLVLFLLREKMITDNIHLINKKIIMIKRKF